VTVSAVTSVCPTPQYRFWVLPPGGRWTVAQDYGSSSTFSWNTSGLAFGAYQIEADVRGQGSAVSYDAVNSLSYSLTSPACASPTLTASAGPPGGTGTPVTFTASAAACPAPQYRFWVQSPGGPWVVARDYATSPTFVWSGGANPGPYGIEVDVRALGSSVSYEAVKGLTYSVVACSGASLSADHTSPQAAGTTVVFTGAASCLGTPQYRFWLQKPGGAWTVVQVYGASATFSWNTAGLAPGIYHLEVDVRNQGTSVSYETVSNVTFSVS
jgi:hypothetical protein